MIETLFESAPLLYTGVFVLGLIFGSFLNVVILRIPALLEFDWRCQCRELLELKNDDEKKPPGIVVSRSRCPKCNNAISARDNVPILSYLILNGKCRACKAPISIRYPVVELTTAVLFVITIWHFGPNLQGLTALLLTTFLIALTGIDFDTQLLPDNMTVPLMWAGILLSFWSVHADLSSSVIGAIAGYMSLWSIYQLFRLLTGKEGMGYGDFKLMAALGAWMGWEYLLLIVFLSSIVGTVFALALRISGRLQQGKPMPFGPFIAAAGWITLIWGDKIIEYYNNYSRSGAFG
jgi:leader peptidase (prepilin peptidase)/N-methyltransferase